MPTRDTATRTGVETVQIETIDGFCRDRGISHLDVLKMDVQGWETEVLQGAAEMLARKAIRFVYAEVGFRARDTDMQAFEPFNRAMDELGYEFCGLYEPSRWGPTKAYVGFANVLYAHPGEWPVTD